MLVLTVDSLFKLALLARNIIRTEEITGGDVFVAAENPIVVGFEDNPNIVAEIHRDEDFWYVSLEELEDDEKDQERLLN